MGSALVLAICLMWALSQPAAAIEADSAQIVDAGFPTTVAGLASADLDNEGLLGTSASLVSPMAQASSAPSVSARPPGDMAAASLWGFETATAESFDYVGLPGRLADPALYDLWRRGLTLESEESLVDAATQYEHIVLEVPEESYTYWRISRNLWRAGESLDVSLKDERYALFVGAEEWATRGIEIDPSCGPCMLWKFVSMGRRATTEGIWNAARYVNEMESLLERGIELQPAHRDDSGNSTLGNLYYAGAVFYRVVPESFWLNLFLGVRGDLDRSLDYIQSAVELSPQRVDYRVELGAVLLCRHTQNHVKGSLEEGMRVLAESRDFPPYLSTDYMDKEHAGLMMSDPNLACGYSRDGFIDVDEAVREAKAQSS